MAAITHPNANLNDLIEDAAKFMTMGLNFGSSRESLKKSLTQARKQAEIGGFKLKCYKNSGSNGGIGVSMVHRPKHSKKAATAALMKTEKSDTSFEHEDSDEPEPAVKP